MRSIQSLFEPLATDYVIAVLIGAASMCSPVVAAHRDSAGGLPCTTAWDCADLDADGIRDNNCLMWICDDNLCSSFSSTFADVGGHGLGCIPDGSADGLDVQQHLSCFANIDPVEARPNHCEINAPLAANVDAGGRLGQCAPDGVCDIHDAYHAIQAFHQESVCTCNAGPAPRGPAIPPDPVGTGRRVFMAVDGQQDAVVVTGNTTLIMQPGETAHIIVWFHDPTRVSDRPDSYQLLWPDAATVLPGAIGSVTYVNGDREVEGRGEGDSIAVDRFRNDWLFATHPIVPDLENTTVYYGEHANLGIFGVLVGALFFTTTYEYDPGTYYLAHFALTASEDAGGEFILPFVREAPLGPRPLSDIVAVDGLDYGVDEWQSLEIRVPHPCVADCADNDADGIRDDGCTWTTCTAGSCESQAIVFADMGGQFGDCDPDGTADSNDRFHALNCFANVDAMGNPGAYPCEFHPNYPPTAYNVDAGGPFGSCLPDGVCDGNDAFHALNAFGQASTCSCPLDGSPMPIARRRKELRR